MLYLFFLAGWLAGYCLIKPKLAETLGQNTWSKEAVAAATRKEKISSSKQCGGGHTLNLYTEK